MIKMDNYYSGSIILIARYSDVLITVAKLSVN